MKGLARKPWRVFDLEHVRRGLWQAWDMSWEVAYNQWRTRPYPSCPSILGTTDPILLDADLVGQFMRLQKGGNALVVFELAEMRDAIVQILPQLHGDCLSYFTEAVEVADLALEERV